MTDTLALNENLATMQDELEKLQRGMKIIDVSSRAIEAAREMSDQALMQKQQAAEQTQILERSLAGHVEQLHGLAAEFQSADLLARITLVDSIVRTFQVSLAQFESRQSDLQDDTRKHSGEVNALIQSHRNEISQTLHQLSVHLQEQAAAITLVQTQGVDVSQSLDGLSTQFTAQAEQSRSEATAQQEALNAQTKSLGTILTTHFKEQAAAITFVQTQGVDVSQSLDGLSAQLTAQAEQSRSEVTAQQEALNAQTKSLGSALTAHFKEQAAAITQVQRRQMADTQEFQQQNAHIISRLAELSASLSRSQAEMVIVREEQKTHRERVETDDREARQKTDGKLNRLHKQHKEEFELYLFRRTIQIRVILAVFVGVLVLLQLLTWVIVLVAR